MGKPILPPRRARGHPRGAKPPWFRPPERTKKIQIIFPEIAFSEKYLDLCALGAHTSDRRHWRGVQRSGAKALRSV